MDHIVRQRIRITGVVQGVGFRPFVYTTAVRHGVTGFVANDSKGVLIEAEGGDEIVARFVSALRENPPSLSHIESLQTAEIPLAGGEGFAIRHSLTLEGENTPVPPDIATCPDCLVELFDPRDRRYRYPFINCTNCGPRFTIIRDLPYDRPLTTMSEFRMCPACEREYQDPSNRRFHAQPVACPDCGPQLLLHPDALHGEAALLEAKRLLTAGAIVAIKGIGGFHLACDATNDDAVEKLRRRKGRSGKPFAVMARSLESIAQYARVNEHEARLLSGAERPIVLLDRLAEPPQPLSPGVAPSLAQLGFFLPYSPLHHLLLDETPLVMTSGNRSDEPIARENQEALERLSALADAFLLHNRGIHTVCDDSVIRTFGASELPIRRSRGYAPLPVALPFEGSSVLGTGGELKATFCLTRGRRAYLSQHIGDMENLETLDAFERALEQMRRLFGIDFAAIACDLHPGYLSSVWAERYAGANGLPLVKVQHHHAHAAALLTEHGLDEKTQIIAIAFDGTGMGTDGAIWGGEILQAGYRSFHRLGHLKYVRLPGGDLAVRNPYRMALAHLAAADIAWEEDLPCVQACPNVERGLLKRQLSLGLNSPNASSAGRLFDAAASLLGIRHQVSYEAQGAIEMESLAASSDDRGAYEFAMNENPELILDPAPVWASMIADLRRGLSSSACAARFHRGMAAAISRCCRKAREQTGLNQVGLTGGVFQNVLLLRWTIAALNAEGFEVLTHRIVPPNDGGIALGQAAIGSLPRNRLQLSDHK